MAPIAMDPINARNAATATMGRSRWVMATVTDPVPLMIGIIIMLAPAIAGADWPWVGGAAIVSGDDDVAGGAMRAGRFTSVVFMLYLDIGLDQCVHHMLPENRRQKQGRHVLKPRGAVDVCSPVSGLNSISSVTPVLDAARLHDYPQCYAESSGPGEPGQFYRVQYPGISGYYGCRLQDCMCQRGNR